MGIFLRVISPVSPKVINRLGIGLVKVREIVVIFSPLTLPSPGRAEEKINKFSRTFTTKIPSLVIKYRRFLLYSRYILG